MLPQYINFNLLDHSLTIYFYGLFLLLSIVIGIFVLYRELRRRDLETHHIFDNIFWIIFGGLIGARLGYAFLYWHFFSEQPLKILEIWNGGLSFTGGFLGSLIVIVLWLWPRERREFWGWLDSFMVAIFIGQIINALGSFIINFHQECFGCWPWIINANLYAVKEAICLAYFYKLLAYLILSLIFILISRRNNKDKLAQQYSGFIFFLGLITVFMVHFMLEFILMSGRPLLVVDYLKITSTHFSSLIIVFCGIIGLWWRASKSTGGSDDSVNNNKKMNKEKIDLLQKKLEEKKANLESQLSKIAKKDKKLKDDYDAEFENYDSEVLDISNEATEVSNYQNRLSLEANLELQLRDVKQALERIEKGTYGQCEKCNGKIKEERLEALPHAKICLKCSS